jgi:purine nucleoside permease
MNDEVHPAFHEYLKALAVLAGMSVQDDTQAELLAALAVTSARVLTMFNVEAVDSFVEQVKMAAPIERADLTAMIAIRTAAQ